MARQSKRPQIGDIVEIRTSKGLAYAQYTHEHIEPPRYGSLLRVMPGIYGQRPFDLSALIQQKEQFRMFFSLKSELKHEDTVFKIIGNEPIPDWAVAFPTFRNGFPDRQGKVHEWWLWDGEKEWKVGKLTPEQVRSYPGLGTANDTALLQMIENGYTSWSPEGRLEGETAKIIPSPGGANVPNSDEQTHQIFQRQPVEQADYPGRSDLFVGSTVRSTPGKRRRDAKAAHSSCYLKIDGINGLEGSAFGDRSQIEDTLDVALQHSKVGRVTGGGTGLRYSYVDFAVTDMSTACDIIRKVLVAGKIPKRSWILFFDPAKAGEWVGVWDDTPPPPQ